MLATVSGTTGRVLAKTLDINGDVTARGRMTVVYRLPHRLCIGCPSGSEQGTAGKASRAGRYSAARAAGRRVPDVSPMLYFRKNLAQLFAIMPTVDVYDRCVFS